MWLARILAINTLTMLKSYRIRRYSIYTDSLYTPNCQNNFDKGFMECVQQKLSEYSKESFNCEDNVLDKSLECYPC